MQNQIEVVSPSTIEASSRAEIDIQIRTAKAYPRSLEQSKERALTLATSDQRTAGAMFYALPRGGKQILGPSVRLAEIIANCWGNIRVASRIVEITQTEIVAEGVAHDLETNTAVRTEVRRKILNKQGKRYNEDMIITTGNSACAIALRNAVFKVVPMAYVQPIYDEAQRKALDSGKSLKESRESLVKVFSEHAITKEQILDYLQKKSMEEVSKEDLVKMRGVYNAIDSGEAMIEDYFPKFSQATDTEKAQFWASVESGDLVDYISEDDKEEAKTATPERLASILDGAMDMKKLDDRADASEGSDE